MQYKIINKKETLFYVLKTNNITYSLFDSQLDLPIYYGSWNMVAGIIANIREYNPYVTILYFSINPKTRQFVFEPQWSINAFHLMNINNY